MPDGISTTAVEAAFLDWKPSTPVYHDIGFDRLFFYGVIINHSNYLCAAYDIAEKSDRSELLTPLGGYFWSRIGNCEGFYRSVLGLYISFGA